jgi:hypothetical protein
MKKKHRDNLLKLAAYLETLPDDYEQFDMDYYMAEIDEDGDLAEELDPNERSKPSCGTVACAVGHGPSAGIRTYRDGDWYEYSYRVFGVGNAMRYENQGQGYNYMFSAVWSHTDNTPKGAAARIRTYVTLGHAPDDWSFGDAKVLS